MQKTKPSLNIEQTYNSNHHYNLNTPAMKKLALFISLIVSFNLYAQPKTDAFLQNILSSNKDSLFQHVLANPEYYRLQIIYTQINRDKNNVPTFKNYYLNVDSLFYFNPASTVKLPLAALSLEKLNEMKIPGVNKYTSMRFDSAYPRQEKELPCGRTPLRPLGRAVPHRWTRPASQHQVPRQAAHRPDRPVPRCLRTTQRAGQAHQGPHLARRGMARMSTRTTPRKPRKPRSGQVCPGQEPEQHAGFRPKGRSLNPANPAALRGLRVIRLGPRDLENAASAPISAGQRRCCGVCGLCGVTFGPTRIARAAGGGGWPPSRRPVRVSRGPPARWKEHSDSSRRYPDHDRAQSGFTKCTLSAWLTQNADGASYCPNCEARRQPRRKNMANSPSSGKCGRSPPAGKVTGLSSASATAATS